MKISVLEIIGDSSLAGAPRHYLSILKYINYDKFFITAVCPPGPLAGEIRHTARKAKLEIVSMDSRLDIKAIKKIHHIILKTNPDIIHVHGTRGGALGRIASIGCNKKVIYTEHLWTKDFRLKSRLMDFLHYNANWFLDLFTTLNIAVSNAVKDFLINKHITYPEKVKVIYNGIAPSTHQAKIFLSDKEFLLATVATLNKNKGIQYLIEAMPEVIKEYPGIQLEIIGDGEYRRTLKNLVEKKKIKNYVKFTGFVPNIEKYLSKFDLYIQPSLSESFGLAILQAMSVGLPVIASNAGGIPEVVTQDKSGILVEPGESQELSKAILTLLRDPKRAKKMGEMASRDARLRFNMKDMIIALENTYESLTKNSTIAE